MYLETKKPRFTWSYLHFNKKYHIRIKIDVWKFSITWTFSLIFTYFFTSSKWYHAYIYVYYVFIFKSIFQTFHPSVYLSVPFLSVISISQRRGVHSVSYNFDTNLAIFNKQNRGYGMVLVCLRLWSGGEYFTGL